MRLLAASALQTQKCTLGCPVLDKLLRGGLPCGLLIELAGEATAAKTQTCFQAMLCTQLSQEKGGLRGSSLYIYTEGDPPTKRLQELAELHPLMRDKPLSSILDNIFVERGIDTGEDLLHCLQKIPALMAKTTDLPLRTVVIDSVGHIFRDAGTATNAGTGTYRDRTGVLFQIAALMKQLATQHNLLLLVCNQVYDFVDGQSSRAHQQGGLAPMVSSGRLLRSSLGKHMIAEVVS
ncbi:hypothetical protein WJX73_005171 [Symbiochloris irregularis]|uniref:RecA family profile 1 domain-containing protein n=1 Tax=Symbiochloris irregularis TaxID=706552 RepID=A0AAW1P825_9CHLO